jgi:hypothetical protein
VPLPTAYSSNDVGGVSANFALPAFSEGRIAPVPYPLIGPGPNGFLPVRYRRPADAPRAPLVEVLAVGSRSSESRQTANQALFPKTRGNSAVASRNGSCSDGELWRTRMHTSLPCSNKFRVIMPPTIPVVFLILVVGCL